MQIAFRGKFFLPLFEFDASLSKRLTLSLQFLDLVVLFPNIVVNCICVGVLGSGLLGVVDTHKQGLPQVVPQFDTCCTTCQVELRRWCAVAVDAADRESVEPLTLTTMTQVYWNEWLWAGITNYKGQPRNDEYTDRLSTKASEFGWDWKLTCPLCRRGLSQLKQEIRDVRDSPDYHHWSTNPDQGITLCRECHDIIGFDSYDNQVEERAHEWGFRSRNDLQIVRLALREASATDQPVQLAMAADLVDRYNLVQSTAEVKELLRAVLLDSNLYIGLSMIRCTKVSLTADHICGTFQSHPLRSARANGWTGPLPARLSSTPTSVSVQRELTTSSTSRTGSVRTSSVMLNAPRTFQHF